MAEMSTNRHYVSVETFHDIDIECNPHRSANSKFCIIFVEAFP